MKPISFNTEMVQAIMRGAKSQTRRLKYLQFINESFNEWEYLGIEDFLPENGGLMHRMRNTDYGVNHAIKCPYGNVGDVLWVRETVCNAGTKEEPYYLYKANGCAPRDESKKWTSSRFMRKDACRMFLKIKSVRIEKLQAISAGDAINEGVENILNDKSNPLNYDTYYKYGTWNDKLQDYYAGSMNAFQALWQSINKNWDDNPFVWVIEFEQTEKPF